MTATTTTAAETPDNNKKQIEVVIEKSKKVDTNNAFAFAITAAADNNEDDDVEDIASLSVGGIFRGTFIYSCLVFVKKQLRFDASIFFLPTSSNLNILILLSFDTLNVQIK